MESDGSSSLFYFILYLYKYIMVLTREEKECLVKNLYNRRTLIREIAREARMSFRDIGRIIDKKREGERSITRTSTTDNSVYTGLYR